jgi:hypothetical protein
LPLPHAVSAAAAVDVGVGPASRWYFNRWGMKPNFRSR